MLTLLIRLKYLSMSRDLTMLLLLILLLSILLLLVLLLRTLFNNILRETRLILTLEVLLVLLVLIMLVLVAIRKLLSTAIVINKAKPRTVPIPARVIHLLLGPGLLLLLRADRRCTVPVVVRVNRLTVPTGLLASVPDEEEAT